MNESIFICFGRFGCGNEVGRAASCECGNMIQKQFKNPELFFIECGQLPSKKVFERAYKTLFNEVAGIFFIEHYLRRRQMLELGLEGKDSFEKPDYIPPGVITRKA